MATTAALDNITEGVPLKCQTTNCQQQTQSQKQTLNHFPVRSHCVQFLNEVILLQWQMFGHQLFIWIGEKAEGEKGLLVNLHLGVPRESTEVLESLCSTCIFGDLDSPGADLAAKLGKK